ncbi:MAG: PHP-associated domain-containing protein [Terriglobia bacterium]
MHVHTVHSGMATMPVLKHFCRECYNPPEVLYEKLKHQGLDLVTVTDHDSIDAGESLRRHSDFFVSEEVTCQAPSGNEVHVGVYDISEPQHVEIQRRRNDLPRLVAYLEEQRVFFSVNHIFSALTGRRAADDFDWFEACFPAVEVLNGHLLPRNNHLAARLASHARKITVGGSDAHALRSAGSVWTEVRGARNKAEFLEGLREGRARVLGESGNYWKLTLDVLTISSEMFRARPFTLLLAPLLPVIPALTFVNHLLEKRFAHRWGQTWARMRGLDGGAAARPIRPAAGEATA